MPRQLQNRTLQVLVLVSLRRTTAFHIQSVPRVSAAAFECDTHYYQEHSPTKEAYSRKDLLYETPVLVENALSLDQCEVICDQLMGSGDDLMVTVQRRTKDNSSERTNENRGNQPITRLYECNLRQAIGLMMQSKPDDCFFCFSEGLLDENGADMQETISVLDSTKENLFKRNNNKHDDDLFQYFPPEIKPSDCVILAGEGATSTFHRDPFSWTGTSLCLEGSKLWRFVVPPGAQRVIPSSKGESGVSSIDDILKSYRLQSSAWNRGSSDEDGEESVPLSAGWQSDFTLYDTRSSSILSAREWSDLEEDSKLEAMIDIALSTDTLTPSPELHKDQDLSIWTVVQNPGDLLVIPAFWWHQTYALEPSLAIASQRCGLSRDTARVINHILETSGANTRGKETKKTELLKNDTFLGQDPEQILSDLFDQLAIEY